MQWYKRFFKFYINSSLHVAIAVYALSVISLKTYNLPYEESVLYFNFFATIVGYNFVKYFGFVKSHYLSLTRNFRLIIVVSVLAFFAMSYYFFKLNLMTQYTIIAMALLTFFYANPRLTKKKLKDEKKNLRQVTGIKIYIIALVWVVVTLILPLLAASKLITGLTIVAAIQLFCFVLASILPFEIRDLAYDHYKLGTIPQRIGIKATKVLGVFLLGIFVGLELFTIEQDPYLISHMAIAAIAAGFIMGSKKSQGPYYSAFWVESLPMIWLMFILLEDYFI